MVRPAKHLVVYDITDNRERRRVSKVLEGYGFRVQRSVFECLLNRSFKKKLKKNLAALELKTGFILIYQLNNNNKRTAIGCCPDDYSNEDYHAFVV